MGRGQYLSGMIEMIKSMIIDGVVTYDEEYDLWCVGECFIENVISDFEDKKCVVTITVVDSDTE